MLKQIVVTVLFLNIFFSNFAQIRVNWQKIDSLENNKEYEKAVLLSSKIADGADTNNNIDDLYQSIIYQIKYKSLLKHKMPDIIAFVENKAEKAKFPLKNILHSIIIDLYINFYQNNAQRINDNLCFENFPCENMLDWSLQRLRQKIMQHVSLSLSRKKELQALKVSDLSSIIAQEDTSKYSFYVYDFLVDRALKFLENKQLAALNEDKKISIEDSLLLLPAKEFLEYQLNGTDSLSPQYFKLMLYREIIKESISQKDSVALAYVDIRRFYSVKKKNKLYVKALEKAITEYKNLSVCSRFYYLSAKYYDKNNRIKARSICSEAIKKYPDTFGAKQCAYLKSRIENADLNFKIHKTICASDSFSLQINYKNIDTLYLKIAQINHDKLIELRNKYFGKELYNNLLHTSKTVSIKTVFLPESGDYFQHQLKIELKSPDEGQYLIFVSNNKKFDYNKNITAYADFSSTKLSYIRHKLADGSIEFYVLDRKTGAPLKNIPVKIYEKKLDFSSGKINKILLKNTVSDKNAYFKINANNKDLKELYLEFKKGKDILITKSPILLYPIKKEIKAYKKIHIITDKNNYQAGETIFFKAILLETYHRKTKTLKNTKVLVNFSIRQKLLSEQIYTSNEYGSFSGSYKIPKELNSGKLELYTPYGTKFININIQNQQKNCSGIMPNDTIASNKIFDVSKQISADTLILNIHSKKKKTALLYELKINDELVQTKWLYINKKSKPIKILITDTSEINAVFTAFKNNRLNTYTEVIHKKNKSGKLNIQLKNFNTENISASQVSWKIQINDAMNKPIEAELLVYLSEDTSNTLNYNDLIKSTYNINQRFYWMHPINNLQNATVISRNFYHFSPLPYQPVNYLKLFNFSLPKNHQKRNYLSKPINFHLTDNKNVIKKNKTAFFLPAVNTNAQGTAYLSVNIPKLTNKWQLNILAIGKNGAFGYLSNRLYIYKLLKIEAEKAAFYRAGDSPLIRAILINRSADTLKGKVRLLLYQNGYKEILSKNEKGTKDFILLPDEKKSIFWKINIPENMSRLRYKIEVRTNQYSDIEENSINIIQMRTALSETETEPVLMNQALDNNSVKLVNNTNIIANKTLHITDKLQQKLSKNAIDLFLKYFTISIKTQYEKSNRKEEEINLLQLLWLQNENGSWSWFKNMPADFGISAYILTGFGRMKKLGLINIKNNLLLRKHILHSIYFLDKQLYKKYQDNDIEILRYKQELLHYFYARSYFSEIPMSEKLETATEFYANKLYNSFNKLKFEEKLMLCIISKRNRWKCEQKFENKVLKDINKYLNQENIPLFIEFLNENKKNKALNKYLAYLYNIKKGHKKYLADALYVLLLNKDADIEQSNEKLINRHIRKKSKALKIKKKFFKTKNGTLHRLSSKSSLSLADTIELRIEIKSKKKLKYISINDNYAALFEPINFKEGCVQENKLIYYQKQNIGSIHFYIEELEKGKYLIKYRFVVKHKGKYVDKAVNIKQMYSIEQPVSSAKYQEFICK